MATPASRLVQDQNLNIHSAGGPPLGGKVDVPRTTKKGAPGGRKALNDISNSGKPSALQASRKHNSINVIPVAKDVGGSKNILAVGGKANFTKGPEKGKNRKALSDLTNSVKPSVHNLSKKDQEKKLNVTVEETIPSAIEEEGFLHNHQECVNAQRKGMNFEYFLETVGLGSQLVLPQPLKLMPESPVKHLEMEEEEEISMPLSVQSWKAQIPDCSSPVFGSPKSIKSPSELWKDEEDLADFKLIESPKLHRH